VLRNIHNLKELLNQVIDYAKRDMSEMAGGKIWNEDDVKIISEGMRIREEVRRLITIVILNLPEGKPLPSCSCDLLDFNVVPRRLSFT